MFKLFIFIGLFFFCQASNGDSSSQTTWTGDSGILGPVTDWYANYYTSNDIYTREQGEFGLTDYHEVRLDSVYTYTYTPHTADINGDGFTDIVASPLAYHTSWWENVEGSDNDWMEHLVATSCSTGIHFSHSGDFNGDGFMDISGGSYWGNCILWWENTDGTGINWLERMIDSSIEMPISISSGDFDNDSDLDVVAASTEANVYWYENVDGTAQSWNKNLIAYCDSPKMVFSADIDGDGDLDVMVSENIEVAWYENVDGTGSNWARHLVLGCSLYGMDVKDMNMDGYLDLIACTGNGKIQWWENVDGSGTVWVYHLVDNVSSISGSDDVYAYDIDNDGDMDIAGSSWHHIYWWENNEGLGLNWTQHVVSRYFRGASGIFADDLDDDGIVEVISTVFQGQSCGLAYWKVADLFSCSMTSSILYLGNDPGWDTLDFSAYSPEGTSVGVAIRSSDDPTMGAWQDTLWEPGSIAGVLSENDSFFQYMVILGRDDVDTSPLFYDITLSWNPVSVFCQSIQILGETQLFPFSPAPVTGSPVVNFFLAEPSSAFVSVFDVSGRIVLRSPMETYSSGNNSIHLEELIPGVYFCNLHVSEQIKSNRFVVVE